MFTASSSSPRHRSSVSAGGSPSILVLMRIFLPIQLLFELLPLRFTASAAEAIKASLTICVLRMAFSRLCVIIFDVIRSWGSLNWGAWLLPGRSNQLARCFPLPASSSSSSSVSVTAQSDGRLTRTPHVLLHSGQAREQLRKRHERVSVLSAQGQGQTFKNKQPRARGVRAHKRTFYRRRIRCSCLACVPASDVYL